MKLFKLEHLRTIFLIALFLAIMMKLLIHIQVNYIR